MDLTGAGVCTRWRELNLCHLLDGRGIRGRVHRGVVLEVRRLEISFDASTRRSNPGPSGVAVILDDVRELAGAPLTLRYEAVEYIGKATNNEAETRALIKALGMAHQQLKVQIPDIAPAKVELVSIKSDSKLVVYQALGKYRVRGNLIPLHTQAMALAGELVRLGIRVDIEHVHREHNVAADTLVTDLMDRRTHRKRH